MTIDFEALAAPFPYEDVRWRPGATNNDKTKALALAYIDARAVMDRLDMVCGPENWQDDYVSAPAGGVLCRLSLHIDDEWVTKADGADNTDVEAVKGGISDALRRAGVKWGIGRYLYNLPNQWVECETYGKSVRLKGRPSLPSWALPAGSKPQQASGVHLPAQRRPVDVETGEVVGAEPVSTPPQSSPPSSPASNGSLWKVFTDQMVVMHIRMEQVRAHIGGFGEAALERYMAEHHITDPIRIIDEIRDTSERQAAMAGGGR